MYVCMYVCMVGMLLLFGERGPIYHWPTDWPGESGEWPGEVSLYLDGWMAGRVYGRFTRYCTHVRPGCTHSQWASVYYKNVHIHNELMRVHNHQSVHIHYELVCVYYKNVHIHSEQPLFICAKPECTHSQWTIICAQPECTHSPWTNVSTRPECTHSLWTNVCMCTTRVYTFTTN